jgi:bifunctional non-homologous end joining protein LigD
MGMFWCRNQPALGQNQPLTGLDNEKFSLDGELCGVLPDGKTAFNLIQNASDTGQGALIYFLFDLLFLDGEDLTALPLLDRKARLQILLSGAPASLRYNDHQIGHGPAFYRLPVSTVSKVSSRNALTADMSLTGAHG